MGLIKGDTRSLDYGSYRVQRFLPLLRVWGRKCHVRQSLESKLLQGIM